MGCVGCRKRLHRRRLSSRPSRASGQYARFRAAALLAWRTRSDAWRRRRRGSRSAWREWRTRRECVRRRAPPSLWPARARRPAASCGATRASWRRAVSTASPGPIRCSARRTRRTARLDCRSVRAAADGCLAGRAPFRGGSGLARTWRRRPVRWSPHSTLGARWAYGRSCRCACQRRPGARAGGPGAPPCRPPGRLRPPRGTAASLHAHILVHVHVRVHYSSTASTHFHFHFGSRSALWVIHSTHQWRVRRGCSRSSTCRWSSSRERRAALQARGRSATGCSCTRAATRNKSSRNRSLWCRCGPGSSAECSPASGHCTCHISISKCH